MKCVAKDWRERWAFIEKNVVAEGGAGEEEFRLCAALINLLLGYADHLEGRVQELEGGGPVSKADLQ